MKNNNYHITRLNELKTAHQEFKTKGTYTDTNNTLFDYLMSLVFLQVQDLYQGSLDKVSQRVLAYEPCTLRQKVQYLIVQVLIVQRHHYTFLLAVFVEVSTD